MHFQQRPRKRYLQWHFFCRKLATMKQEITQGNSLVSSYICFLFAHFGKTWIYMILTSRISENIFIHFYPKIFTLDLNFKYLIRVAFLISATTVNDVLWLNCVKRRLKVVNV